MATRMIAESAPAKIGDTNQEATMASRPGLPHFTQEAPAPTKVIPSTAPTITCVVDTGMAAHVATSMNSAPEASAHAIPAQAPPQMCCEASSIISLSCSYLGVSCCVLVAAS